jgi:hypothetical protein
VAIAARGGYLAWIEAAPSGPALMMPGGAGSARHVGAAGFSTLAAGDRGVFAFDSGGALLSIGWDGTTLGTLDPGESGVGALAAGESTVYFTLPQAGEIQQVLEP